MPIVSKRLQFRVFDKKIFPKFSSFPVVELVRSNWDDFGLKTLFEATVHLAPNEAVELGEVKIMNIDSPRGFSAVNDSFTSLDEIHVSLGQSIEYYEKLLQLDENLRAEYLKALRDSAADPEVEKTARFYSGWSNSLLRFGGAVNALTEGRKLLKDEGSPVGQLSFTLHWQQEDGVVPIDFAFDATGDLPGRAHVIIGYNGVGKTTLLADLAFAASAGRSKVPKKPRPLSAISGRDVTFGAVVSISYSAFDTFPRPTLPKTDKNSLEKGETGRFGYTYCGLRRGAANASSKSNEGQVSDSGEAAQLKSIDEIESEFFKALERATLESGEILVEALKALSLEPSFGRAGVDVVAFAGPIRSRESRTLFSGLSTGHKIVLNIVAQLAANLQTRSLVLLDEPETHLHPPLMAALLRSIHVLLNRHDSYAIVATHSPVVVQETLSTYVRVLERYGDEIKVLPPTIETYGESIDPITRNVFSLDSAATDFQGVLEDLSISKSLSEIKAMFPGGLSSQAYALVLTYQAHQ